MSEASTRTKALLAFILLAVMAAADGVYLTLVHLDYETGSSQAADVCHALTEAGCSVTAGRFGAVWGIPVATIGFAGAITMLVLAIAALRRRKEFDDPIRSVLLVASGGSVLASLTMGSLSVVEGSFCPFCVVWYAINLGLFACAFWARNRSATGSDLIDDALGTWGFVAVGILTATLLLGGLVHHQRRAELLEERQEELQEHAPEIAEQIVAELLAKPPKPFDTAGMPSKGPDDAEVRIVEFGDFECPHCRKLWTVLEDYVQSTDRSVQVQFANFPLSSECNPHVDRVIHPAACRAAKAALCAERQGKFWELGDLLFQNQGDLELEDIRGYAEQVGLDADELVSCLDDPAIADRIAADVQLGYRLDIRATPTFYVNDVEITGAFPPPIFAAVVEEILEAQSSQ